MQAVKIVKFCPEFRQTGNPEADVWRNSSWSQKELLQLVHVWLWFKKLSFFKNNLFLPFSFLSLWSVGSYGRFNIRVTRAVCQGKEENHVLWWTVAFTWSYLWRFHEAKQSLDWIIASDTNWIFSLSWQDFYLYNKSCFSSARVGILLRVERKKDLISFQCHFSSAPFFLRDNIFDERPVTV